MVGIDSSIVGAVQRDERGHLLSASCVLSVNCLIGTSPQSVEGGLLQPLLQPRGQRHSEEGVKWGFQPGRLTSVDKQPLPGLL